MQERMRSANFTYLAKKSDLPCHVSHIIGKHEHTSLSVYFFTEPISFYLYLCFYLCFLLMLLPMFLLMFLLMIYICFYL